MKETGVRQDDPDFIKAHNLLSAITHSQNFAKQRLQAQQVQQQQQHQINGASSSATANGTNGVSQIVFDSIFRN
jgi:ATP-dependent helicase STH1/SNF2